MIHKILIVCFSVMFLTGCISREQADEKMAKGCAAGVNSLIAPKEIMTVKNIRYGNDDLQGVGIHRRVTIEAVEKDDWLELDKEYYCVFLEQWGLFKADHKALMVQINIDGTIYGKQDGKIIGDFDDFLSLTRVVDSAMGQ